MQKNDVRRTLALSALVVLAAVSANAGAEAWMLQPGATRLGFVAHTKLFDVKGTFSRFEADARIDEADLTQSSLRMTVDVASLDTGMEMRDEHLRAADFLDVRRFPAATFVSTKVEKTKKPDELKVHGKLTIRGVTKDVVVPVRVAMQDEGGARTLRAQGRITVDRYAYGVAYEGGMLLPKVDKEVDITFDVGVAPKHHALAQASR